jgi:hypothetical protein
MSNKIKLQDVALPQEVLDISGTQYLVTAMPATKGLQFLEAQQQAIESGKPDFAVMKQVVCAYVTKDNMPITAERFDVYFARRLGHLRDLFNAVFQWNFGEVFLEPDSED